MVSQTSQNETLSVAKDVFSSGQIGSKLWLIQILERLLVGYRPARSPMTVWIYGGWQGALGFLLLCRDGTEASVPLANIRSFDIDSAATDAANVLCENWVWRDWKFRAFTADCNLLNPREPGVEYGACPDLIINTSVEHFASNKWFEHIPAGTVVAFQGASFPHEGADPLVQSEVRSDGELQKRFPLAESWFSGSLHFDYGTWSFDRYMIIGVK